MQTWSDDLINWTPVEDCNGKNRTDIKRDLHYNPGTYSAGQVLFDLKGPFKAIKRLEKPFFILSNLSKEMVNMLMELFL